MKKKRKKIETDSKIEGKIQIFVSQRSTAIVYGKRKHIKNLLSYLCRLLINFRFMRFKTIGKFFARAF